jgi:hypothetical protein
VTRVETADVGETAEPGEQQLSVRDVGRERCET